MCEKGEGARSTIPAFIRTRGTVKRSPLTAPRLQAGVPQVLPPPFACPSTTSFAGRSSPPPPRGDDVTRRRHGCVASVARVVAWALMPASTRLSFSSIPRKESEERWALCPLRAAAAAAAYFGDPESSGRRAGYVRPAKRAGGSLAHTRAEETKGKANANTTGATCASNPKPPTFRIRPGRSERICHSADHPPSLRRPVQECCTLLHMATETDSGIFSGGWWLSETCRRNICQHLRDKTRRTRYYQNQKRTLL